MNHATTRRWSPSASVAALAPRNPMSGASSRGGMSPSPSRAAPALLNWNTVTLSAPLGPTNATWTPPSNPKTRYASTCWVCAVVIHGASGMSIVPPAVMTPLSSSARRKPGEAVRTTRLFGHATGLSWRRRAVEYETPSRVMRSRTWRLKLRPSVMRPPARAAHVPNDTSARVADHSGPRAHDPLCPTEARWEA